MTTRPSHQRQDDQAGERARPSVEEIARAIREALPEKMRLRMVALIGFDFDEAVSDILAQAVLALLDAPPHVAPETPVERWGSVVNRQARRALNARGLSMFIFFRAEGWYPVEIPADQLDENIRLNPGTVRVEDMAGNVVWRAEDARVATSRGEG